MKCFYYYYYVFIYLDNIIGGHPWCTLSPYRSLQEGNQFDGKIHFLSCASSSSNRTFTSPQNKSKSHTRIIHNIHCVGHTVLNPRNQ